MNRRGSNSKVILKENDFDKGSFDTRTKNIVWVCKMLNWSDKVLFWYSSHKGSSYTTVLSGLESTCKSDLSLNFWPTSNALVTCVKPIETPNPTLERPELGFSRFQPSRKARWFEKRSQKTLFKTLNQILDSRLNARDQKKRYEWKPNYCFCWAQLLLVVPCQRLPRATVKLRLLRVTQKWTAQIITFLTVINADAIST